MSNEFNKILEAFDKRESFFALSDYFILGEELTIIKALGAQLSIYNDLLLHNNHSQKDMKIEIPIHVLSGLGKAIMRIAAQMDDKINLLEKRCFLKPRVLKDEKV